MADLYLVSKQGELPCSVVYEDGGIVTILNQPISRTVDPTTPTAQRVPFTAIAVDSTGERAVAADRLGNFLLFDLTAQEYRRVRNTTLEGVQMMFSAAHENWCYIAMPDSSIRCYDLESGDLLARLTAHKGEIVALAQSSDGSMLLSASQDVVLLWSTSDWTRRRSLGALADVVHATIASGAGYVIVAFANDTIVVWDLATLEVVAKLSLTDPERNAGLRYVACADDGSIVVAGASNGCVYVWDVASSALVRIIDAPAPASAVVQVQVITSATATLQASAVLSASQSGSGGVGGGRGAYGSSPPQLIILGDDGRLLMIELGPQVCTAVLELESPQGHGLITAFSLSRDAGTLAITTDDGRCLLYDVPQAKIHRIESMANIGAGDDDGGAAEGEDREEEEEEAEEQYNASSTLSSRKQQQQQQQQQQQNLSYVALQGEKETDGNTARDEEEEQDEEEEEESFSQLERGPLLGSRSSSSTTRKRQTSTPPLPVSQPSIATQTGIEAAAEEEEKDDIVEEEDQEEEVVIETIQRSHHHHPAPSRTTAVGISSSSSLSSSAAAAEKEEDIENQYDDLREPPQPFLRSSHSRHFRERQQQQQQQTSSLAADSSTSHHTTDAKHVREGDVVGFPHAPYAVRQQAYVDGFGGKDRGAGSIIRNTNGGGFLGIATRSAITRGVAGSETRARTGGALRAAVGASPDLAGPPGAPLHELLGRSTAVMNSNWYGAANAAGSGVTAAAAAAIPQNIVDSASIATHKKLSTLLDTHGQFPSKYRSFAWRFCCRLPRNQESFSALIARGPHITWEDLEERYPVKDRRLSSRLSRVVNALAHWSPVFGEIPFLPVTAFPFVKFFGADDMVSTEMIMTVLTNWGAHWIETLPHPPLPLLGRIHALLCHHDKELAYHLEASGADPTRYAWPLLRSCMSEVLTRNEWEILWDHLFVAAHDPSLLCYAVVAYLITFRGPLLGIKAPASSHSTGPSSSSGGGGGGVWPHPGGRPGTGGIGSSSSSSGVFASSMPGFNGPQASLQARVITLALAEICAFLRHQNPINIRAYLKLMYTLRSRTPQHAHPYPVNAEDRRAAAAAGGGAGGGENFEEDATFVTAGMRTRGGKVPGSSQSIPVISNAPPPTTPIFPFTGPLHALPQGHYPPFLRYPSYIVDHQRAERRRIAEEEEELKQRRDVSRAAVHKQAALESDIEAARIERNMRIAQEARKSAEVEWTEKVLQRQSALLEVQEATTRRMNALNALQAKNHSSNTNANSRSIAGRRRVVSTMNDNYDDGEEENYLAVTATNWSPNKQKEDGVLTSSGGMHVNNRVISPKLPPSSSSSSSSSTSISRQPQGVGVVVGGQHTDVEEDEHAQQQQEQLNMSAGDMALRASIEAAEAAANAAKAEARARNRAAAAVLALASEKAAIATAAAEKEKAASAAAVAATAAANAASVAAAEASEASMTMAAYNNNEESRDDAVRKNTSPARKTVPGDHVLLLDTTRTPIRSGHQTPLDTSQTSSSTAAIAAEAATSFLYAAAASSQPAAPLAVPGPSRTALGSPATPPTYSKRVSVIENNSTSIDAEHAAPHNTQTHPQKSESDEQNISVPHLDGTSSGNDAHNNNFTSSRSSTSSHSVLSSTTNKKDKSNSNSSSTTTNTSGGLVFANAVEGAERVTATPSLGSKTAPAITSSSRSSNSNSFIVNVENGDHEEEDGGGWASPSSEVLESGAL